MLAATSSPPCVYPALDAETLQGQNSLWIFSLTFGLMFWGPDFFLQRPGRIKAQTILPSKEFLKVVGMSGMRITSQKSAAKAAFEPVEYPGL